MDRLETQFSGIPPLLNDFPARLGVREGKAGQRRYARES
jgi:hypothetical protein